MEYCECLLSTKEGVEEEHIFWKGASYWNNQETTVTRVADVQTAANKMENTKFFGRDELLTEIYVYGRKT